MFSFCAYVPHRTHCESCFCFSSTVLNLFSDRFSDIDRYWLEFALCSAIGDAGGGDQSDDDDGDWGRVFKAGSSTRWELGPCADPARDTVLARSPASRRTLQVSIRSADWRPVSDHCEWAENHTELKITLLSASKITFPVLWWIVTIFLRHL